MCLVQSVPLQEFLNFGVWNTRLLGKD
ncbi:hypothetical protein VULLAG_LOCUS21972 [Vulpes lagopus]